MPYKSCHLLAILLPMFVLDKCVEVGYLSCRSYLEGLSQWSRWVKTLRALQRLALHGDPFTCHNKLNGKWLTWGFSFQDYWPSCVFKDKWKGSQQTLMIPKHKRKGYDFQWRPPTVCCHIPLKDKTPRIRSTHEACALLPSGDGSWLPDLSPSFRSS